MNISKDASRKILAGLGLFLNLELWIGSSSEKIAEFFNVEHQHKSEQVEVKNGR